jgi:anaerobic ribonucleoside-triphosphate reductase
MTTAILDTLQIAKKAKEAGFTDKQAEFYAENLAEIVDSQVATKQDIKTLESEIAVKLAETKAEIIKWQIGTLLTILGLMVTIFLKFPH